MIRISRLQPGIRASRSLPPVETTASPGIRRLRPTCCRSAGLRSEITSSGTYQSETAWFWSGGGYSPDEPEPGYQSVVQTTGQRSTPDVAFDANPSTGVEIYETSPRSGKGSWQVYGGTSLGAPAWAGIIAIVDQGRALAGKGSLDGPTQTIPSLYALPESDFKSAVLPKGFWVLADCRRYSADLFTSDHSGATANIATGLGSPSGPSLITDLVSSTIATQPFLTGESGQSGSGLSLSHITKPKKHTETRSTHRKMLQNDHHIRRQRVRSSSVAGQRISAPGRAWRGISVNQKTGAEFVRTINPSLDKRCQEPITKFDRRSSNKTGQQWMLKAPNRFLTPFLASCGSDSLARNFLDSAPGVPENSLTMVSGDGVRHKPPPERLMTPTGWLFLRVGHRMSFALRGSIPGGFFFDAHDSLRMNLGHAEGLQQCRFSTMPRLGPYGAGFSIFIAEWRNLRRVSCQARCPHRFQGA